MFALLSQPAALALSAPLIQPRLGVASRAPPVVAAATERYLAGTLKTSSPNVAPAADAIKRMWGAWRDDGSVTSVTESCGDLGTEECTALCDDDGCSVMPPNSLLKKAKLGVYFALWFALSTGYNIANKQRLNSIALPWTHSAVSLLVGTLFVTPLWLTGLRKPPRLAGAGAVSFTQIVKAAEPVFTCVLSAIVLGQYISMPVAFSLVPIVFGVALASVTELSFTWVAFSGAMLSNLAFALRNILSRASMDKPKGENMTPENLFGVLTVLSFLVAAPLAIAFEWLPGLVGAKWAEATARVGVKTIAAQSISTGLYFYLYNEVAMMALSNIHPVTHAVANTIKRVVILLACVVFFQTPMTPLCMAGSSIAIIGSYFYAMAKGADKAKAAAAKAS
jgi:solute carrier family 35 protein E1